MGIAITEPHAGSGATDMHSRAAIEGDEIVINGHKAYVEDTAAMGSFLVYAKFDDRPGARSIGGVILDKGTPGFRIGPPRKKMGTRGCIQADLYIRELPRSQAQPDRRPRRVRQTYDGLQSRALWQRSHGRRHCRRSIR